METHSTYSLLVRSHEKGRSIFEAAVYALVVLSTVVSIYQFTAQALTLPTQASTKSISPTVVAARTLAPAQS